MSDVPDVEALESAARGGRVAHSTFLPEAESADWWARLRSRGVAASAWGGVPAAARRVVSARPEHVPEVTPPLHALYLPEVEVEGEDEVRIALRAVGAEETLLGDAVRHPEGLALITLGEAPAAWLVPLRIAGRSVVPQPVPVARLAMGSRKRTQVVVPSLRADALGAKAFGASRAWFAKGVASGKVRVDGRTAGKSTTVEHGSEVWAEGLGRMRLLEVAGETKRGNLKVVLEIEKP